MRSIAALFVIVACVMTVPTAGAGELAGVTMADRITVGDDELVLNGLGLRKKLWVEVYVAGLYLDTPVRDGAAAIEASGTKRVVMHFLTDKVTKKKLDDAWDEGFSANSPAVAGAVASRLGTFKAFFGDMKVGDVVELTVVPGAGTTVVVNGSTKGVIEGDDFGAALLRVWLGDHPPSDELKAGMLGS
ncbi:MAG: chalcone isomerase family protein [Thermoanaerobaculales bacterium]|nr:chalcone isomerase family protein [Thermoanaerobaculales bacterium]